MMNITKVGELHNVLHKKDLSSACVFEGGCGKRTVMRTVRITQPPSKTSTEQEHFLCKINAIFIHL